MRVVWYTAKTGWDSLANLSVLMAWIQVCSQNWNQLYFIFFLLSLWMSRIFSSIFPTQNTSPTGFKMASKNKRSDFQNTTERIIKLQYKTGKLGKEWIVRPHPLATHYSTSLFAEGEMSPTTFHNFLPLLKANDMLYWIYFQNPKDTSNHKSINNNKSKEQCRRKICYTK